MIGQWDKDCPKCAERALDILYKLELRKILNGLMGGYYDFKDEGNRKEYTKQMRLYGGLKKDGLIHLIQQAREIRKDDIIFNKIMEHIKDLRRKDHYKSNID